MNRSRGALIAALALSLLGCATTSTPPEASPAIARLSPEELARMMPPARSSLTQADIVRLSKEGATAKDIIAKIRETGSRYDLSASQAIDLHAQGVDKEVLDYMQSARAQELRDRMADEINQRELRHAEQLRREQEFRLNRPYYDPWPGSYPGYGWGPAYPLRPFGGFYWRR
jgi:hypothetical protein